MKKVKFSCCLVLIIVETIINPIRKDVMEIILHIAGKRLIIFPGTTGVYSFLI